MRLVLRRISVTLRNSTKSIVGLNSRQTSLGTTISSSSIPQSYDVDHEVSRVAKLDESSALVTKTAHVKRVQSRLKRKTRNAKGQILSKFFIFLVVICLSNYSTGKLSESHDSSTDSDSDKEAESELDNRLAQKKRKIDNA
jgi:hypothetical protein